MASVADDVNGRRRLNVENIMVNDSAREKTSIRFSLSAHI